MDAAQALTSEGFEQVQAEYLRSEIGVRPARSFSASLIGHPCARYIVWSFTKHEKKAPHSETLQSIFNQGKDHQPIIYRRLEALGYEIVRESDRVIDYKIGRARVSGRADGRVIGFRGEVIKPSKIIEIKTLQGHIWSRFHTVDDIRNARQAYMRAYYSQGQVYCFLDNLEGGLFVLENKANGLLKLIPFELDYDHAEAILKRVEALAPMVEEEKDPPPITFDWDTCGRCGFLNECFPRKDFGEGVTLIDDDFLVQKLRRREELQSDAREFGRLDKDVKEQLKYLGIKEAIVGPYVVDGKKYPRAGYTVEPGDVIRYSIKPLGKVADEA